MAVSGLRVAVLNWRDAEHPKAGGAETFALEVAKNLAERGAFVAYVTARHPGSSAMDARDGYSVIRGGGTFSVYIYALRWLRRNRKQIDLVIDCSNGIGFFSPLVTTKQNKVVYLTHHIHLEQWSQQFAAPIAAFGRFLEKVVTPLVYRKATWVAVSESTAQGIHERLGVKNHVAIAHNGLDQSQLPAPVQASNGRVIFVGRPVVHKRLDVLIDAIAKSASLELDVVGHGDEMAALQERAQPLGQRVRFHGALSNSQRDILIAQSAVLAIPSDHEGWGLVVLEAAVLGVPSVGFDVAGVHDAIRDKETGWLLPAAGSNEVLSAALCEALELAVEYGADKKQREAMAARTKKWAGKFTWENTTEAILAAAKIDVETKGGNR